MIDFVTGMLREANKPLPEVQPVYAVLDGVEMESTDRAGAYEIGALKLDVAAALAQWAESDETDEDESPSDRLLALIAGLCDIDKNGEIDGDEADLISRAYGIAGEYLANKGADESDIRAFLEDDDNDAGENIREFLQNQLPDDEDDAAQDMENFAFGDGSDESVLDAAYRRVKAVRNGKKVVIRKRISGKVRLSAKQKLAIAKMHRKAHSGKARMKRLKSMKKRAKMGL